MIYALVFLATLALALFLTVAARAMARNLGVVDWPDGRRKLHDRPIPLCGGLAVYGATALGLLAVQLFGLCPKLTELSGAWLIVAGIVCFLGGVDDRFDLPSRLKLALQIVAVLPIVFFGHCIDTIMLFGQPIELGWLGAPLTILWLVGCINALNLIDGMDGLASIVGLSAAVITGAIAAGEGNGHVAVMALVLSASIMGFMIYNLPPASVFLGDSGSMVLGLSIGLLGIQGNVKSTATLAITAPAVVMTLPMFDIAAALVRRKLTGRRFDSPDRLHIHHRLLDRGWTPWQVLCLVGAVCLTTGAAAAAATIFRRDALAWITAISLVVLMIRLRLFGYEEFALAKSALVKTRRKCVSWMRYFVGASFRRKSPGRVIVLGPPIPQCSTPLLTTPLLWETLLRHVRTWEVRRVEFHVVENQQMRHLRWIDPGLSATEPCRWSVSASSPTTDGGVCQLRVSSTRPIDDDEDLATLTALLKTFVAHFAEHSERLMGPQARTERPRKAA